VLTPCSWLLSTERCPSREADLEDVWADARWWDGVRERAAPLMVQAPVAVAA
jgi:hypothetical protein